MICTVFIPFEDTFACVYKILFSRRLNSILIFYLDVALKDSFSLAHQFDDVINLAVTQMANTVCNPFFFKEDRNE